MGNVNSIISIPTSLDGSFFKHWLNFLRPFHKLSDRETDVAAALLQHRYILSKDISNETLLDRVLLEEAERHAIEKELNISTSHLQVILSKLKKTKFIVDGKINARFIPNIKEDKERYTLVLVFDFTKKQ